MPFAAAWLPAISASTSLSRPAIRETAPATATPDPAAAREAMHRHLLQSDEDSDVYLTADTDGPSVSRPVSSTQE